MKNVMKYSVAGIFLSTSAFAGPPPTSSAPDEIVQDATNAFNIWTGSNNNLAKRMDTLAAAYRALQTENTQLKDELAKAKAPSPVAPPAH